MSLPPRISRKSDKENHGRRSPAHRAWIRGFACSACGSTTAIECAHVRNGTDGGTGLKPSDEWCLALCKSCHSRQHQIGEKSFEKEAGIDLKAMAQAFLKASPHRAKLGSIT